MRIYLAGPMSNIKAFNIPAFDAAANLLRSCGHKVVSPAEMDGPVSREVLLRSATGDHADLPEGEAWSYYLARDFRLLADDGIDAIVTLPGWERSRGARCEVAVGEIMGIQRFDYEPRSARGYINPLEAEEWDYTGPANSLEKVDTREIGNALAAADAARHLAAAVSGLYDADGAFVLYKDNPLRQRSAQGGAKDNRGKSRVDLLPSRPLLSIGDVMAHGALKYQPHNWRLGLAWSDTMASTMRHLLAFGDGEDLDPESGLPHLAHAGCQVLFLLEYYLTGTGTDDRWSSSDREEAKA